MVLHGVRAYAEIALQVEDDYGDVTSGATATSEIRSD